MSVAVIGAKLSPYLPMLLLTVSILIGVPLAYRYYRDVREKDDPLRDSDLLADLVHGDAASKMTEAEFRRVRDLLTAAETGRGARPRAKPPQAKPKNVAAALNPEEPGSSEPGERTLGEETRQNRTETERNPD